ncbi:von Willebrand factor [Posidoniimonas corsicana]|uniref:von Willebrand factor n=1 Tax=Posidoniimonas corsicana TaxID=1938618 RepID=A0A5C5UXG6_9BACT|nr:von Willebrand factor type A domain-containing protein [Posidoniimonas corsicana]TWT30310.1 von Willebrand factor [Posidoniimonas corsicana]
MSEPNTNPAANADSAAADRLIDLGLRETLGGESPPDLSEQILARLADSPQPQEPDMNGAASRTRPWLTYALAASVLFCLGLLARPALDSSTGLLVQSDPQPTGSQQRDRRPTTDAKHAGPADSELDLLVSTVQELPVDDSLLAESVISESQSGPAEADRSTRFMVGVGVNGDAGVVGQILAGEDAWEELTDRVPPTGAKEVAGEAKESIDDDLVRVANDRSGVSLATPRIVIEEAKEPRAGVAPNEGPEVRYSVAAPQDAPLGSSTQTAVSDALAANRSVHQNQQNFNWSAQSATTPPKPLAGAATVDAFSLSTGSMPSTASPAETAGRSRYFYSSSGDRNGYGVVQHGFGDARAVAANDKIDPEVYRWMVTRNGRETFEESAEQSRGRLRLQQQLLIEDEVQGQGPDASGDKYQPIHENPFIAAEGLQAVSTFSIDVDTASYANVRQMLTSGRLPPPDAVRLEELINYFDYDYAGPTDDAPFAAHAEVAGCPWNAKHRLARIGVKGRELAADKRPLSNLVFLIDVSGSMQDAEKLPLVVEGMKSLTSQLGENDRVAIVVYASSEGLALPSTPGDQQDVILGVLDKLAAGGSTAGGAGIQLAYQIAEDHFIEGGANRVILCTDGDFNVGTTSTGDLQRMVEQKAKDTGVFLSVCGFGRGNLNDAMMETISNKGNGNYYYIDSQREAEKVFVKGLTGTLVTIAKDVKIQVEFNPLHVAAYRLLGYENRMLAAQDFNDDKKDAGEIGAGHTVTALYEIVPAGEPAPTPELDELRYQRPNQPLDGKMAGELMTLKMRYKLPDEDQSTKRVWPVTDGGAAFGQASPDMQFASAAAGFGMLLRGSAYSGDLTWEAVREIAQPGVGEDPHGYRTEFVSLVDRAAQLRPTPRPADAVEEKPAAPATAAGEDSEQEADGSGE